MVRFYYDRETFVMDCDSEAVEFEGYTGPLYFGSINSEEDHKKADRTAKFVEAAMHAFKVDRMELRMDGAAGCTVFALENGEVIIG